MGRDARNPAASVVGPDGNHLTLADLPSPDTKRWVARHKALVVVAVQDGLITLDEACRRYALTTEEFLTWRYAVSRFGLPGLRTTRAQQFRES